MKKILIGYILDGETGGIDRYLINLLQRIPFDQEDIQVDFLTNHITPQLEEHLRPYHARAYEVASLKHPLRQYRQMVKLIRENQYDITYFNISTTLHCIGAMAAKRCNVKRRLIHSHSSGVDIDNPLLRGGLSLLNNIGRWFLYRQGTEFLACSDVAGLWLFPKKVVTSPNFQIVLNAIDTSSFTFSPAIREEVRREFHLEDKLVLGHVGFFSYQKNHPFLLKVFEQVHREHPNAVLMLVGQGKYFDQIVQQVRQAGLEDAVLFLGQRKDVNRLMQAMDLFLFPSVFEGLGIVGVEAQVSGLPCLFSDQVPREVQFTPHCAFLGIRSKADVSAWAKQVADFSALSHRSDASELAFQAGYNAQEQDISFLLGEVIK